MTWRLLGQEPVKVPGGQVRIVDSSNFPAANTIAAALVELDPGAMRELHWHPTNDEWQYYISGQGADDRVRLERQGEDLRLPGRRRGLRAVRDGPLHPEHRHEPLRFLEMFRSDHYADISLNQWLALTPPELVQAHLNLDDATTNAVTAYKGKPLIIR